MVGFDASPGAVNTEDQLFGLRFLFAMFPTIFYLASCAIIWNYPITEERQAEMRKELEAENKMLGTSG